MSALALDLRALLLSVYPGDAFFKLNVPEDPERNEARVRAIVYHRHMSAGEHSVSLLTELALAKGYGRHAHAVFELAPADAFAALEPSEVILQRIFACFMRFSDVTGIEDRTWEPFVIPQRFEASFSEIEQLGIIAVVEGNTCWNDDARRFLPGV
ncbi:hypothetical protein [Halocynthiibacter namhaensis]|uniref:hypothetical protein n=1 Tax=Halocynthiibacter namhaensis TaxID=1290553 RepID=UPI0005791E7D|nr:hypothetical protein [Halocynthiibacter namhaensis]